MEEYHEHMIHLVKAMREQLVDMIKRIKDMEEVADDMGLEFNQQMDDIYHVSNNWFWSAVVMLLLTMIAIAVIFYQKFSSMGNYDTFGRKL
jgi:hypothetical protein